MASDPIRRYSEEVTQALELICLVTLKEAIGGLVFEYVIRGQIPVPQPAKVHGAHGGPLRAHVPDDHRPVSPGVLLLVQVLSQFEVFHDVNMVNIFAGACFRGSAVSSCKCLVPNDALLQIIPPVSIVAVNKVLEGSAPESAAENESEQEANHRGEAHNSLILRLTHVLTFSRVIFHDCRLSLYHVVSVRYIVGTFDNVPYKSLTYT